ncbi:MAG: hypothetical protein PQJ46_17615 [Spirochaetales bacterium]|nr:hypothetical protein [Spirochaetales bacterium]
MNKTSLSFLTKFLLSAILLLSLTAIEAFSESMDGTIEEEYYSKIVDLSPQQFFNRSDKGSTADSKTMSDLELDSIFIDPNGDIYKVTDIYEVNGQTVIETKSPDFSEVFKKLEIPDFELDIERDDIVDIGDGVTLLSEEESRDISNFYSSDFPSGSKLTVPDDTKSTLSFNINVLLWPTDSQSRAAYYASTKDESTTEQAVEAMELVESLTTKVPKRKGVNYDVSNEIEVTLQGSFNFSTGFIGYYKSDKAKARLHVTQSLDVTLNGTYNTEDSVRIYIAGFKKTVKKIKFAGGVYLRARLDGEISVEIEVYEGTEHYVGGYTKNRWYIPYKYHTISRHYYKLGCKPSVAADAYLRVGPGVGATMKYRKMSFADIDLNTGVGVSVDGFVGATEMIGRKNGNNYGNSSNWVKDLTGRVFAFIDADGAIFGAEKTLFDHSWTLRRWSN